MVTPQYQIIRADIEARIVSGDLPPGTKLPTEAELQAEHGVSRSVAQRVLNELSQAGLVVRRKRLGTHVSDGARQLNLMRSVDPRIGDANLPGRMDVVSAEVVAAGEALVDLPGWDDDEPVVQLIRPRIDPALETPSVVEVSAVPFQLAPRLLTEKLEDISIRSYLSEQGVSISRSRMYFDPELLDQHMAGLLDLEEGTAVLKRRRYMWDAGGQLLESAAYYLRPGAMEFYIEYSDQK